MKQFSTMTVSESFNHHILFYSEVVGTRFWEGEKQGSGPGKDDIFKMKNIKTITKITRLAKIKKSQNPKVNEDADQQELSYMAGGRANWWKHFRKLFGCIHGSWASHSCEQQPASQSCLQPAETSFMQTYASLHEELTSVLKMLIFGVK